MTTEGPHAAVGCFDRLLEVRDTVRHHLKANSNDIAWHFAHYCTYHFMNSHAQLFQDLLVIFLLKGKRGGFFVEFGATNGRDLSNTFALEQHFGWRGILAEPAKCWHAALKANRKAAIETRCVWSRSGEQLEFKETEVAELSTLSDLAGKDFNEASRAKGTVYPVQTISLNDLLKTHNAPRDIDYVSIDTEGSELPILQAFDFAAYDVKIMTVEHNFVEPNRQEIFDLLSGKGFMRVFEPLSKFDDWYVKRSLLGQ
ncbi:MAG TPA: FkbM family methyltransferase [Pseudolabrys sp.]|nr:FkbM family methyltransferase [Pseudolabrys sp.]